MSAAAKRFIQTAFVLALTLQTSLVQKISLANDYGAKPDRTKVSFSQSNGEANPKDVPYGEPK